MYILVSVFFWFSCFNSGILRQLLTTKVEKSGYNFVHKTPENIELANKLNVEFTNLNRIPITSIFGDYGNKTVFMTVKNKFLKRKVNIVDLTKMRLL